MLKINTNFHGRMRIVVITIVAAAVLLVAGFVHALQSKVSAATNVLDDPIYHVVNTSTRAAVLTSWESEANNASKYGFGAPETIFQASRTPEKGLLPVYRLYNPKTNDFLYTVGENEKNNTAPRYGYVYDQIAFYAQPYAKQGAQPVYRYHQNGKHRYAITQAQRDALTASGWKQINISFYALPITDTQTTPSDPTTPTDPTPPVVNPTPANPAEGDGVFTFAIMPDTQQEVYASAGDQFQERTRWVAGLKETRDLRFVGHTGDVISAGASKTDPDNFYQLDVASAAFKTLDDAKVPYTLSAGNHDTGAVCGGGGACTGKTWELIRDTERFNTYFNSSRLNLTSDQQFEAGKSENSYRTFTAEGRNWLVLTLEMNARVTAINWARSVVASHPTYNVIIQSHYVFEGNGTISTSNAGYGATSGRYLYDNLVLQYPNVKMVFSGHTGTAKSRTDVGVNGNTVYGFLAALHSNDYNPTRIVTVNVKNGTITSDIEAASIRDGYKQQNPNATLPTYNEFDVTYGNVTFVTP